MILARFFLTCIGFRAALRDFRPVSRATGRAHRAQCFERAGRRRRRLAECRPRGQRECSHRYLQMKFHRCLPGCPNSHGRSARRWGARYQCAGGDDCQMASVLCLRGERLRCGATAKVPETLPAIVRTCAAAISQSDLHENDPALSEAGSREFGVYRYFPAQTGKRIAEKRRVKGILSAISRDFFPNYCRAAFARHAHESQRTGARLHRNRTQVAFSRLSRYRGFSFPTLQRMDMTSDWTGRDRRSSSGTAAGIEARPPSMREMIRLVSILTRADPSAVGVVVAVAAAAVIAVGSRCRSADCCGTETPLRTAVRATG